MGLERDGGGLGVAIVVVGLLAPLSLLRFCEGGEVVLQGGAPDEKKIRVSVKEEKYVEKQ